MTMIEYLASLITPTIQTNNPGASADEVTQYATTLAGFMIDCVIPNLQVNLTTGAVTFVVPSS